MAMSSKRRVRRKQQRRGCLDKDPYPSETAAEKQVYSLLRRSRNDPMKAKAGFLKAYRCKFCGAWHIGNQKDAASMSRFIGMLRDKGVIR
jgi:hypothetical protein